MNNLEQENDLHKYLDELDKQIEELEKALKSMGEVENE